MLILSVEILSVEIYVEYIFPKESALYSECMYWISMLNINYVLTQCKICWTVLVDYVWIYFVLLSTMFI